MLELVILANFKISQLTTSLRNKKYILTVHSTLCVLPQPFMWNIYDTKSALPGHVQVDVGIADVHNTGVGTAGVTISGASC